MIGITDGSFIFIGVLAIVEIALWVGVMRELVAGMHSMAVITSIAPIYIAFFAFIFASAYVMHIYYK
jgi:hypothetical protein